LASIGDDPSTFLLRDANGNYSFDQDGQYVKMNFETITKNDFMTFLTSDNASEFAFADQSIKSYFNYLGKYTINDYLSGLGEDEVPTSEGFAVWLASGNNNRVLKYLDTLGLSPDEKAILIQNIGGELTASLTASGVTLDITTNLSTSTSNGTTGGTTTSSGTTTPAWDPTKDTPESVVNYYKNPFTNTTLTWDKLTSAYGNFADIAGFAWTKNDIAEQFAQDNQLFKDYFVDKKSFGTGKPSKETLKNTFDLLNRLHEISGGSSPKETGVTLMAMKLGVPVDSIKFEKFFNDYSRTGDANANYGFKISPANLTREQKDALIAKGFREYSGMLIINGESLINLDDKNKGWNWGDGVGGEADYPTGTGWNTGERGELKIIARWMHWFDMNWKS
jgi:hypothetical protein